YRRKSTAAGSLWSPFIHRKKSDDKIQRLRGSCHRSISGSAPDSSFLCIS
ncbi:hypothetical protein SUGI_0781620, partial [Cryptomeria japonica]